MPDFSGLELVMEDSIGQTGEAKTTNFTAWISSKLKEKAQVQKQARLYKEEFGRGRGSTGSGDAEQKGRGRGRGKAKGKSRGGNDAPASGS